MGREVGGGIGMGNTCKPMADSFQCMTKSTTIKIIILIIKLKKQKNKRDIKKKMESWKAPEKLKASGHCLSRLDTAEKPSTRDGNEKQAPLCCRTRETPDLGT